MTLLSLTVAAVLIAMVLAFFAALFGKVEETPVGRRKPPPPLVDPDSEGEKFRGAMRESIECNLSLVWWWVKNRHNIDLSDRDQASAVQVYRIVLPIVELGDVFLTAAILHELVDANVKTVFGVK